MSRTGMDDDGLGLNILKSESRLCHCPVFD